MDADVPPAFVCPITYEIMTDPVSTADGHSYEREAIKNWLKDNNTSPSTNTPLEHSRISDNIALRQSIEEWRETYYKLVRSGDLDVEPNTISSGSVRTVFQGKMKRLPGSPTPLREHLVVAVIEQIDGGPLEAEAALLSHLAYNPRLVRYFGMCTERANPCLVMELSDKGSVHNLVRNASADVSSAHDLAIMQQISSGMEMLASLGIVHRGLALSNVLLFSFDKSNVDATSVKVCEP